MIDPELIPVIAARFKALGEPGRLAILASLHGGERSVGEIVDETGRGQPNVSQHLGYLLRAGLVTSRREGNRVLYIHADPHLERICDSVCRSLEARTQRESRTVGRALKRRSGGHGGSRG